MEPLECSDSYLLDPVDKLIMKNKFPGEKIFQLLGIETEFRVSKHIGWSPGSRAPPLGTPLVSVKITIESYKIVVKLKNRF